MGKSSMGHAVNIMCTCVRVVDFFNFFYNNKYVVKTLYTATSRWNSISNRQHVIVDFIQMVSPRSAVYRLISLYYNCYPGILQTSRIFIQFFAMITEKNNCIKNNADQRIRRNIYAISVILFIYVFQFGVLRRYAENIQQLNNNKINIIPYKKFNISK